MTLDTMKPLILGIDPGTTSAVAAVNLEGELEFVESRREFPVEEMIRFVMDRGRPVVVSSDKEKTPDTVKDFASSLGLELFEPGRDLEADRKDRLGDGDNSHEIDASASAFYAYNNLERSIQKIERIAETRDLTVLEASEHYFLDKEFEERDDSQTENEEKTEEPEASREARLERKISRLENRLEKLEEENEKLRKKKPEIIESESSESEEIRKREAIIREKNRDISELEERLENREKIIKAYRKALDKLNDGGLLVPKAWKLHDPDTPYATREESGTEEAYPEDELEGLELQRFYVVDELPEKSFREVVEEYRKSR